MARTRESFPPHIQRFALGRQNYRCAMCGTRISDIGHGGSTSHHYGEWAEGHHVIPDMMGGPITSDNCVVICRTCHISAHQGGRFADVSIYDDLKGMSMPQMIAKISVLYEHYNG